MKKLILFVIASLALTGCGSQSNSSATGLQVIEAQQAKELNVIEAQKQKDEAILNQQHALQAQEEQARQASIEGCLSNARQQAKDILNAMFQRLGMNDEAGVTDAIQLINDTNAACQKMYAGDVAGCIKTTVDFEEKVLADEKADEAACYARFK